MTTSLLHTPWFAVSCFSSVRCHVCATALQLRDSVGGSWRYHHCQLQARTSPCCTGLPQVGWDGSIAFGNFSSILVLANQGSRCPLHFTGELLRAASVAGGLQFASSSLVWFRVVSVTALSFSCCAGNRFEGPVAMALAISACLPLLQLLLVEVRWSQTWPALQPRGSVYRPRSEGATCLLLGHTFHTNRIRSNIPRR